MERILQIWPSIAHVAADLGLPYTTVHSWVTRGVPRQRYRQIIDAARARGEVVTVVDLVQQASEEDAA